MLPSNTDMATGGIEVPRLLLASASGRGGLGNDHDLVGRDPRAQQDRDPVDQLGRRGLLAQLALLAQPVELDQHLVEELRVEGHRGAVTGLAFASARTLVSAGHDGAVKVWDLESGDEERTLEGHADWVKCVAVTPDGRRAISALDNSTLKVWLSGNPVVRCRKRDE